MTIDPLNPTSVCARREASPTADVLFVAGQPLWPLDQGFKVHGLHMARALRKLGVSVAIASVEPLPNDVPDDVRALHIDWPTANDIQHARWRSAQRGWVGALRRRMTRYRWLKVEELAGAVELIDARRPLAVVGLGIPGAILAKLMQPVTVAPCVWYGADELLHYHATCMKREPVTRWPGRWRRMADDALFESLFVRGLDGAIGVSPTDTRLLKRIAGAKRAVTVRNGVDLDTFTPNDNVQPRDTSLVFWGRLDFEPNIDAVTWFARAVWPRLCAEQPDATWRIVGKCPTKRVLELNAIPGIDVVGPVDDIRNEAWSAQVTVLPMRCGGGIKNKLLEAAAMGCPIVASPRAVNGLEAGDGPLPWRLSGSVEDWVRQITDLWRQAEHRAELGQHARRWVEAFHDWRGAAQAMVDWLEEFTSHIAQHKIDHRLPSDDGYRRAA